MAASDRASKTCVGGAVTTFKEQQKPGNGSELGTHKGTASPESALSYLGHFLKSQLR